MTNLALRDRRHQQAQKEFSRLERQRDATLDKLARIATKLKAVRRSIERYQRTPALPAARPAASVKVGPPMPPQAAPASAAPQPLDRELIEAATDAIGHPPVNPVKPGIDLEIPGFLKRTGTIGNKTPADLAAIAAIEAEKAARKSTKKSVQAERRKAKQAGDLKKMPLEGRAAIEYLRTGKRS